MAPLNHKPKPTNAHPPLIQKPKPTLAQIERKRNKPPGYCAAAAEQKARIIQNKAARNQLGGDGFPKGKKLVNSLLKSPEMAMAAAIMIVGMTSLGKALRGIGGALVGLVGGAVVSAGDRNARISAPASVPAPRAGIETPQQRQRRAARPAMGGGDGDSGSTGPRSGRRQAAPAPRPTLSPREQSRKRGEDVRAKAKAHYGDERVFALVAAVIGYKPGVQNNPADDPRTWDRLRKLHPDLPDYLQSIGPASVEMRNLRAEMEGTAAKLAGGSAGMADKDDLGAAITGRIEAKAADWRLSQSNPSSGGPRPEASVDGGAENAAKAPTPKAGAAPTPEDDDYTPPLPTPKGF